METEMSSQAGKFLIARSALVDGFFGRSVVLLLQHNPEGAFGLVLNRPAEAKDLPFPIFVGGPCKMDGLLMIHGMKDWASENDETAMEVCPGIYLGTPSQFTHVTESPSDSGDKFRVFTGYAGWGPDQLETEMEEGAWIVLPATGEILFNTPVQELWERLAPPVLPQPSMN
jgi:putative transcriptional regulator